MPIGLPKIEIIFKQKAVTAVQRSTKGVVVLILKDSTGSFDLKEYKSIDKIEAADWTADNLKYINDAFLGTPAKVIAVSVATTTTDLIADAVEKLANKKFNWICVPGGSSTDQQALATWVKGQNTNNGKTYKALVFNATVADDMHIVNFTNTNVKPKDADEITGDKYLARLAGIFAGLPMTMSATYYVLQDLESVTEPEDVEAAINDGELVLINDDEEVKIARAVNSLVTLTTDQTEDMKKIIIVESMDMILEDIRSTFKDFYVGKYKNNYDNQVLFISAINSYFKTLAGEDILDINYSNKAFVDVETQRNAWLSIGKVEAETWDELAVKNNTFRSNVYLGGNIKILDAMEDLKFNITML
ncbi:hypothetical protein HNQ80_004324 [Anaerosolibacter carboniphilus]|uniref:Phage tail sheath protein n=1 Tax=Anaerosolibacter carboniphilus TaxID=1417629 RepID=A0A841KX31_9FIRM|nr:phage tail sheath C-terminal domain-containing protein [Anaerosolibacter carboniphilus]MBB6218184.1 hypothetical protein [Anaerosolibacter carboniphilus]